MNTLPAQENGVTGLHLKAPAAERGLLPPMNTASAAGKIMEPSIGKSAAAERYLKRAPITSANGS